MHYQTLHSTSTNCCSINLVQTCPTYIGQINVAILFYQLKNGSSHMTCRTSPYQSSLPPGHMIMTGQGSGSWSWRDLEKTLARNSLLLERNFHYLQSVILPWDWLVWSNLMIPSLGSLYVEYGNTSFFSLLLAWSTWVPPWVWICPCWYQGI